MRITFVVALFALLSSTALAQESVQVETEAAPNALVSDIDTMAENADGEAVSENVVRADVVPTAVAVSEVVSPEVVSTEAVLENEIINTIEPVVYVQPVAYQSGTVDGGMDVVGSVEGAIQGNVVTEPSSVVTGEVIQSDPIYSGSDPVYSGGAPIYSEGAPMVDGGMIADGGGAGCGCGTSAAAPVSVAGPVPVASAPAPAMTYSSAPAIQYSAPVSAAPCCNQPRRGLIRRLFGN